MKVTLLSILACILLVPLIAAQRKPSNSACLQAIPAGVVLDICEHERGMAPIPQPRLYLRVYTDGRAEYEVNTTSDSLVRKEFRLTPAEVAEIRRLGGMDDFQRAQDNYPAYLQGIDSRSETTLNFYDKLVAKKIVLLNFDSQVRRIEKYYPPSLFLLMERVDEHREKAMGIVREIPAINYCEMIKNRQDYVRKKISVYADIKLPFDGQGTDLDGRTVILTRDGGGEYLYDAECDGARVKSLRTAGTVGIGFAPGADAPKLRRQLAQLREDRFEGRARVQATGFLREEHGDLNYPYRYRFDVEKFESFDQIVLPFQGELEQGWIYSDTFDYDAGAWVIRLSQPFKRPNDRSVRIQWKNEKDFPTLKKSGRKSIVFRVILRTTDGITNKETIYFCEILELK